MCPSPSMSASLIISSTSSSVSFSPRLVMTCLSSAAEISPFPSLSNTLKASINYSSVSVSFIFLSLIANKPGHERQKFREINGAVTVSIHFVDHVLKLSFSGILTQRSHDSSEFLSKASDTFVVMEPSPFLSKRANASLNSAICSSLSWSAMSFEKSNIKIITNTQPFYINKEF